MIGAKCPDRYVEQDNPPVEDSTVGLNRQFFKNFGERLQPRGTPIQRFSIPRFRVVLSG